MQTGILLTRALTDSIIVLMKQKGSMAIFVFIAVVVLLGLPSFYSYLKKGLYHQDSPKTQETNNTSNSLLGQRAFVGYVPNFDNLQLKDLPSLKDIRLLYPYKNLIIVVGANRIVYYDPQAQTIIKQNTEILSCVVSAAVIDNYLYVGCNGTMKGTQPNVSWTPSTLYKLNLDSEKIEKIYFGDSQKDHTLINLRLVADNKTLWGSSNDEVFKLDTNDGSFTFYSLQHLGFPSDCVSQGIYSDKGVIKVSTWDNKPPCVGGSIYNNQKDSWQYLSAEKASAPFLHDYQIISALTLENESKFPSFVAISNLVSYKYYLFGKGNIDTLNNQQFPKKFMKLSGYLSDVVAKNALVNSKEEYAILVGWPVLYEGIGFPFSIYLIDMKTGITEDLLKNEKNVNLFYKLSSDRQFKVRQNLSSDKLIFNESGTIIKINGEILVDLSTKLVSFQ